MTNGVAINWNRVRAAIRCFNRHPRWPWEDAAIHEVRGQGIDMPRLPGLVAVVNQGWQAGLQWPREVALMSAQVGRSGELLVEAGRLDGVKLQDTEFCCQVGRRMLALLMTGAGTRKGVFAMKFIHWCEPRVLPPLDSRAWLAINHLTRQNLPWPGDVGWTLQDCQNSWERALNFYAAVLSSEDAEDLVEFDLSTQRIERRYRNTLVRVFDKYLWLEGQVQHNRLERERARGAGS